MRIRLNILLSFAFFAVFVFLLPHDVWAEEVDLIFTSPRKIRMLLQTEKSVSQTIDAYITSERDRLREIEDYIQEWQKEHEIRAADKFKYFENPYSKYHLTKKLTLDWQRINEKMKQNNATDYLNNLYSQSELLWPDKNDWEGVQDSILNIQLINRYKASDLSNGKIGPLSTNVELTFDECLALMKRSEHNYNYNLALEWAAASVLKFFSTPNADDKHMTDVVWTNLISNIIEGNFTQAEHYLNIYSMLKPSSVEIENLRNLMLKRSPTPSAYALRMREKFANMTRLCSQPAPISYGDNLRCGYNFKNSPFLRIAPLKEEIVSLNPRIIIFRDVLYDSEIEKLIQEGKNRIFEESKTVKDKSEKIEFSDRLNEFVLLENNDFKEIISLSQRTRDMTGLSENLAQPWQITVYGVGGFFHEHSDINQANGEELEKYGRRVATISYSLNNVGLGGATIFPQIGVKVDPHRGDALVWFNLQKDGTEDSGVRHAGCPVLMGYKWELIKRINENTMSTRNR